MSQRMTVVHRIPAQYSRGHQIIEVYGDPEHGVYEWRVIDAGGAGLDTGTEGAHGRQYGNAEIALRDALIETSQGEISGVAS